MEGMVKLPKCLDLSSTVVTNALLSLSPYVSLLTPTMWNFSG